jgi:hypothetical protein|tara:strand:- start:435 stop:635 length:201 start_codon:yes stop_codon:yes gene_type:complete
MNINKETRYLTEADIDIIAEKAADRALEKVYADVGKNVTKKFLWVVGAAAIAAAFWFNGIGGIPKV